MAADVTILLRHLGSAFGTLARALFGFAGIVVSIAGCGGHPRIPAPETSRLASQIRSAFERSKTAVINEPKSPTEWGMYGKLCMAHHFVNDAIECFRQASKRDSHDPRWPYFQAVLSEEFDLEQSLALYETTLSIEPKNAVARFRLSQVLIRLGQYEKAQDQLQQVALLVPGHPAVLLSQARLAMAMSDWNTAESILLTALKASPHSHDLFLELSRVAARKELWSQAIQYQRQSQLASAHEVGMDDPWLREVTELQMAGQPESDRADRLLADGQIAAAVTVLQRAVHDHPKLARARLNLAIALWQMGKTSESQTQFNELIRQFPNEATGYLAWGRLLASVGRLEDAKQRLEQAIARKPDSGESCAMLAMVLERQGHYQEASRWIQQSIRVAPHVASNYLLLASVFAQLGDFESAESALDSMSRLPLEPGLKVEAERLHQQFKSRDRNSNPNPQEDTSGRVPP